jgi:hypothetical protein
MPAIALTRVDLPAALSPTTQTTSPPRSVMLTSVSGWTPPNRTPSWSTSSRVRPPGRPVVATCGSPSDSGGAPVEAPRRARRSRCSSWSDVRASNSIVPRTSCWYQSSSPAKISPALKMPIVTTPTRTPIGWPRPPVNATPPRMTAVSTSVSHCTPTTGDPLASWAVLSKAATPIRAPLPAKAETTSRRTGTPSLTAEVRSPPIAYSRSPVTVVTSSTEPTTKIARATSAITGTPRTRRCPNSRNDSVSPETEPPPPTTYARPR